MDSNTHTDPIHAPPAEDSIRSGHEVRDVSIRGVLGLAAAVLAGGIVVHVVLWFVLQGLEVSAKQADPELSPLAETRPEPPAPRLQDRPSHDYAAYRAEQEARLNSYGWVDRDRGVVHLPVSRAMELILEQGLPEPASKEQP